MNFDQLKTLRDDAIAADAGGANWGTPEQIRTENAFFHAASETLGGIELIDPSGYLLSATFPESIGFVWEKVERHFDK